MPTWYSFIHWCGGKKEQFVWKRKRFFPPSPSLLSTVYQCDGCLSSRGCGGSWLVCQVLPAISAVSVVVLAAKSGSSRMAQTPNAHLMTQSLITLTIIHININLIQWLPNPVWNAAFIHYSKNFADFCKFSCWLMKTIINSRWILMS